MHCCLTRDFWSVWIACIQRCLHSSATLCDGLWRRAWEHIGTKKPLLRKRSHERLRRCRLHGHILSLERSPNKKDFDFTSAIACICFSTSMPSCPEFEDPFSAAIKAEWLSSAEAMEFATLAEAWVQSAGAAREELGLCIRFTYWASKAWKVFAPSPPARHDAEMYSKQI